MPEPTDAISPSGFVPEPPADEVEGAVPPGYDWPTHGGYLGCFVATIAACLLTGFIGANLFSFLYIARRWPFPVFALLTALLFFALLIGLGRLGWRLGKRFYRYYPQPKPTWGESEEATEEEVEEGTPPTTAAREGAMLDADTEGARPEDSEASGESRSGPPPALDPASRRDEPEA